MNDAINNLKKLMEPEDLHPDLVPYLKVSTSLGQMIHHPLIIEIMYHESRNRMINLQYKHKTDRLEQARRERDWTTYVFLHERPYRFDAFCEIHDAAGFWANDPINDREFWKLVSSIWIDSENIHQHLVEWIGIWSSDREFRETVMDEDDIEAFTKLPESFPIWRGAGHRRVAEGLSWTTDKAKATWFAHRFASSRRHDAAFLAQGVVHRGDVLAYFIGRNESEIVVLPDKVQSVRVQKLRPKKK